MHPLKNVRYPALAKILHIPGLKPNYLTELGVSWPFGYGAYIAQCLKQKSCTLPKPQLELSQYLSRILEAEQCMNYKKSEQSKDEYIDILLGCAHRNEDTLEDYKKLFEHESYHKGAIKRLFHVLEYCDQLGRSHEDPRVQYVFDRLVMAVQNERHRKVESYTTVTTPDAEYLRCIQTIYSRAVGGEAQLVADEALRFCLSVGRPKTYSELYELLLTSVQRHGSEFIPHFFMLIRKCFPDEASFKLGLMAIPAVVTQIPEMNLESLAEDLGEKFTGVFWKTESSFQKDCAHFQLFRETLEKIRGGAVSFEEFVSEKSFTKHPFRSQALYDNELKMLFSAFFSSQNGLSQVIDHLLSTSDKKLQDPLEKACLAYLEELLYDQRELTVPIRRAISTLSFERKQALCAVRLKMTSELQECIFKNLTESEMRSLATQLDKKGSLNEYAKAFFLPDHNTSESYTPKNPDEDDGFNYAVTTLAPFCGSMVPDHLERADLPLQGDVELLKRLPFGLATTIANTGVVPDSIRGLIERFEKANAHVGPDHAENFDNFMLEFLIKIYNLHELMGHEVFVLLTRCTETSVLWLRRTLESLELLPPELSPTIQRLYSRFEKHQAKEFFELLLLIGNVNYFVNLLNPYHGLMHADMAELQKILELMLDDSDITILKIQEKISIELAALYQKVLPIPKDTKLDFQKLLNSKGILSSLLGGRRRLQNGKFSTVLDRLILETLSEGGDFENFTTNLEQTDPLGAAIALHNYKIKNELKVAGINASLAFHYPVKARFELTRTRKLDAHTIRRAVWNDLQSLAVELRKLDNSLVGKMLKAHTTLIAQVTHNCKDQQPKLPRLDNKCWPLLNEVLELYLQLKQHGGLPNSFYEHGDHLADRVKLLMQLKASVTSEPFTEEQSKTYLIQQVDKGKSETLLQGNAWGCCLATNGTQFEAMIQRIIDHDMQMIEIVDTDTKESVCGNWLYLARDRNNPTHVYVVANFIEIRAGLGTNPEIRDRMVAELNAYTAAYAKAIDAKGYLMAPLTYGLIPDFKNHFPVIDIVVEKVGGYFHPIELQTYPSTDTDSQARYYLNSVEQTQFYLHPDSVPVQTQKPELKDPKAKDLPFYAVTKSKERYPTQRRKNESATYSVRTQSAHPCDRGSGN